MKNPTFPAFVLLLLLFHPHGGLSAQTARDLREAPFLGAGYTGSFGAAIAGGGISRIWNGIGLGLLLEGRMTPDNPRGSPEFSETLTLVDARLTYMDAEIERREVHRSASLSVIRPLTGDLALFLGPSISRHRSYIQFADESQERGIDGVYWIEDPEGDGTSMGVVGGLLFRLGSSALFQIGGATMPKGMVAGFQIGTRR